LLSTSNRLKCPQDLQEISINLPRKLHAISKLLILKQVILWTMEHGKEPTNDREPAGSASAGAGIEPTTGERDCPALASGSVGATDLPDGRFPEFKWSLATYFGQSFVVGAYRAPNRG
jgi:hypothetical protein